MARRYVLEVWTGKGWAPVGKLWVDAPDRYDVRANVVCTLVPYALARESSRRAPWLRRTSV